MKKTSIYLAPDLDRELARIAERAGISKAELIRQTLAARIQGTPRPKPKGAGQFSGPSDLARNADEYLRRSGFGGR